MTRIAIITGSTRPGRNAAQVAAWVLQAAATRADAAFDLVDIADYDLGHLDEPIPASMGQYTQAHTLDWAQTIAAYDGFVFVTPEYNHSIPGALKTAIDFVYAEWNDKAAGFVSYGSSAGGCRAVEHLRLVMAELQVATVSEQVALSVLTDFEEYRRFRPAAHHQQQLVRMLDQVVSWSTALQSLRVAA